MADTIARITPAYFLGVNITNPKALGAKVDELIRYVNDILDGTTTLTEVEVGNGTAAAPSMSFTSDTDTGIYRIGANNLGITAGGTLRLDISSTAVTSAIPVIVTDATDATTSTTGSIKTAGGMGIAKALYVGTSVNATTYVTSGNGTVSLPAIGPVADVDTGMYFPAANKVAIATQGAAILTLDGSVASGATGISVTSAASGAGVAIAATGGAAEALTINAKGTGTIGIGSVSTGVVTITPATTVTGALTPTGGVVAAGGFSIAPNLIHTGGIPADVSTFGSELTIVNTELYVAQVFIPANCTVTGVSFMTGATTDGNAKVMLFDSTGARVAISASTDISGFTADTYNRVAFTGTYAAKGPATYYIGIICDTNTNIINTHTFGDFRAGKITGLVYATEAGYATITPPTTFTTALGPVASLY